jgi:hypothetical protein
MKKKDTVLKEFVRSISDEDLRFSCSRLGQRLSGDLPDVIEFFQLFPDIDRILLNSKDSFGLYDLLDELQEYLEREIKRRSFTERVEVS